MLSQKSWDSEDKQTNGGHNPQADVELGATGIAMMEITRTTNEI